DQPRDGAGARGLRRRSGAGAATGPLRVAPRRVAGDAGRRAGRYPTRGLIPAPCAGGWTLDVALARVPVTPGPPPTGAGVVFARESHRRRSRGRAPSGRPGDLDGRGWRRRTGGTLGGAVP